MFSTKIVLKQCTALVGSIFCISLLSALSARAQTLGVDVYSGTGTINWTNVKSAGISFAWAKATEGTTYIDANIGVNEANGKNNGVYMGAYHFAHPEKNAPDTEAVYFWDVASNYIKADARTLMPMLDYETFPGPVVGAANYADWANQWCLDVQALAAASGVSVTPVIYISACNTTELSSLDNWTIPWIADYNGEGPESGSPWDVSICTPNKIWPSDWNGTNWVVWQYTSSASVSGITGNCDEDVFNGDTNQLTNVLVVGQIQLTTRLTNITVVAGSSATFNVAATSLGTPLTYQWRFNQKNISGAITNTYTVTNAQVSNAGAYSVMITNNTGNIINTAFLTVLGPLVNGANSPLDPPNLVNWWTGDGNGYDIYGTNNLIPGGNLVYTNNGEVGLAFRLDGQTTGLPVPAGSEIAPNWTACMWVYHQRSKCTAASLLGDKLYALKVEQFSNTDDVGISHSGVGDYLFSPAYSVPLNKWTHLAFVATSTAVTLYTNGIQEGTVTVSGFELPRQYIGADQFSTITNVLEDFAMGSLDDIQIFNRALGASEIASIYSAGSAGLVRAPQFTNISTNGNGQIQLNLIGQTGKAITLNSSTNLQSNWTQLGTIANQFGTTNFTDPDSSESAKFYQATQKY